MADIFISYASGGRQQASVVAQTLGGEGFDVWFDRELIPGARWDTTIEAELDAARCVVVLWSTSSLISTWVRNEARRAKHKLVPVSIEPVQRPLEFDHLQEVDLIGWSGDTASPAFRKLVWCSILFGT